MKHLVLGSSGQVGAYVKDEILKSGDQVIEWDLELNHEHDLRVPNAYFNSVVEECDFVHFLAYDVGGSKYLDSYQNSYEYIKNNILIMENVFEQLRIYNKPFYFASSQMSNMFHSTYGRLKAVGESYTKSLSGVNIRFWNVYGYETNPEKTHVITDFIRMALYDKKINMRTSGIEERNFIYGADAAKMLVNLSNKIINNQINLSDNNPISDSINNFGAVPILSSQPFISMLDLAKVIIDIVDKNIEVVPNQNKFDTVQGIKNNIDLQFVYLLNKFLGLDYETSLNDGIKDIIQKEKISNRSLL